MDRRTRYLAAAAALAVPAFLAGSVAAQSGDSAASWTAPRTASGQPDFQGHWTNDTYTPLERPVELGELGLVDERNLEPSRGDPQLVRQIRLRRSLGPLRQGRIDT